VGKCAKKVKRGITFVSVGGWPIAGQISIEYSGLVASQYKGGGGMYCESKGSVLNFSVLAHEQSMQTISLPPKGVRGMGVQL